MHQHQKKLFRVFEKARLYRHLGGEKQEMLPQVDATGKALKDVIAVVVLFAFQDFTIICVIDNNCKTSIFHFHRSFPSCSYDLWHNCCREIRDGHLQGGGKEVITEYVSRGLYYLHGGKESVELLPETSPKCSGRAFMS
ncbi:unnamed protein product [Prunus brigantina]